MTPAIQSDHLPSYLRLVATHSCHARPAQHRRSAQVFAGQKSGRRAALLHWAAVLINRPASLWRTLRLIEIKQVRMGKISNLKHLRSENKDDKIVVCAAQSAEDRGQSEKSGNGAEWNTCPAACQQPAERSGRY